jgi:hypothetical protein
LANQPAAGFPRTIISWPIPGEVTVELNTKYGTDVAYFAATFPNSYFVVQTHFPAGTLPSDALPLALPLERATYAQWLVYDFGPLVRGTISSYSAIEVPEPCSTGSVLAGLIFLESISMSGRSDRRAMHRLGLGWSKREVFTPIPCAARA